MTRIFGRFSRMVFNAEGGGGAGGGGAGAPAGGTAAPAPAASSPAAPSPSSGAAPSPSAAPSPAGEPAAGAANPAPAASVYRPEGLPDHMLGTSDSETIDNMKKALDGYRARDAEQKIPEDPKAYGEFSGEIPEAIKPHIEKLTGDPLYDRVASAAAKLKLSVPQYQGLVMEMMSASAEMGILEPPVNEAAEKAALVPDNARHLPEAEQRAAREKRMTENFAYIDQMVRLGRDKGGLSAEAGDYAKAMLGDTARGHEFIEFLRAQGGGGHKGPAMDLNGGSGAADPKAEISRRAALPENTWGDPKFDQKSYDQLQADRRKVYGD
ncbi:MAG: hypothetical protein ACK4PN_08420 [Allorhizobium sp.]